MTERKTARDVNANKPNAFLSLNDFVEYVEKQASTMERFGWKEGHGLRKWISELRNKSSRNIALEE